MERLVVILTHDVDWPRHGPPIDHVLSRLCRFSLEERWRFLVYRENIYYGIGKVVEWEETYGIKSTFLFRPVYDDGSLVDNYSDVINELVRGGWEVGLHANNTTSLNDLVREKELVEKASGVRITSVRAHYLRIDTRLIPQLGSIGLRVDSSTCLSRDTLNNLSCGVYVTVKTRVFEAPVSLMDAYLFTYWKVKPEKVADVVVKAIHEYARLGCDVVTVLWHADSVRMVGGREYKRILEKLWTIEWVEFGKLSDIPGLVEKGLLTPKPFETLVKALEARRYA